MSKNAEEKTFVFSFPTVEHNRYLNDVVLKVGWNEFLNYQSTNQAQSAAIVTPNVDTLYSQAVIDLTQGPVDLFIPVITDRYYSLQFIDLLTNNFAYVSNRTNPNNLQHFTMTYDNFQCASAASVANQINTATNCNQINIIKSPSQIVLILVRIYAGSGNKNLEIAKILQSKMQICSESNHIRPILSPYYNAKQARIDPITYWNSFLRLYQYTQPVVAMDALIDQVSNALRSNNYGQIQQVVDGFSSGQKLIMNSVKNPSDTSSSDKWFSTDNSCADKDLCRAVIAWQYVYANDPREAIYYATYEDGLGSPLMGNASYFLDLTKVQLDDVIDFPGFWSVTAYNENGYLMSNRWNKWSVNSGEKINFVPNRFLQGKETLNVNTIPIGDGEKFYVIVRTYLPRYPVKLPNINKCNP